MIFYIITKTFDKNICFIYKRQQHITIAGENSDDNRSMLDGERNNADIKINYAD